MLAGRGGRRANDAAGGAAVCGTALSQRFHCSTLALEGFLRASSGLQTGSWLPTSTRAVSGLTPAVLQAPHPLTVPVHQVQRAVKEEGRELFGDK